ncbi:hypothetical protein ACQP3L_38780, partial [Escherichia coli]
ALYYEARSQNKTAKEQRKPVLGVKIGYALPIHFFQTGPYNVDKMFSNARATKFTHTHLLV